MFNDTERAKVARAWKDSGLTAKAYAACTGISERTLRAWRVEFPDTEGVVNDGDALTAAIHRLQEALAEVSRAVDSALAAAAACRSLAAAVPPPESAERGLTQDAVRVEADVASAAGAAPGGSSGNADLQNAGATTPTGKAPEVQQANRGDGGGQRRKRGLFTEMFAEFS